MSAWSPEQVAAAAPTPSAFATAQPIARAANWAGAGADDRGVWGSYRGSSAEPYDVVVDHVAVRYRCTCPSRRVPCKHALALLLLWSHGHVPDATPPARVETWLAAHTRTPAAPPPGAAASGPGATGDAPAPGDRADTPGDGSARGDAAVDVPDDGAGALGDTSTRTDAAGDEDVPGESASSAGRARPGDGERDHAAERTPAGGSGRDAVGASGSEGAAGADDIDPPPQPPPDPGERDPSRDERVERMRAGLDELDRWIEDRMRTGLSDPALAQYDTWDQLAARLVDARAGSLANRVRRLAGLVGASPDWHGRVLAELGVLHLLAEAGRRLGSLPGPLADAVATTVGWQVRQADVLAGVPDTDDWIVAGRSDTREDRIEVRRHWLRGATSGRWAVVLSFAAYRQSLDTSLVVGTALRGDLHRYPGPALRALVGRREGEWLLGARPPAEDVTAACRSIGELLVDEPWLDRVPFTVSASVRSGSDGWVLGDDHGSLPLLRPASVGAGGRLTGDAVDRGLAALVAVSAGSPVDVTCEWTPQGIVPLTIHLDDHTIDIGPRADPSFVSAA